MWEGGRVGGRPGQLFGTSVAVFALSIPNRYLPILQEGEAEPQDLDGKKSFVPTRVRDMELATAKRIGTDQASKLVAREDRTMDASVSGVHEGASQK